MPRTGEIADLTPAGTPPTVYAADMPPFDRGRALEAGARADVAVVGDGYAGLSTALHLARAGRSVRVLEAATVGAGASGRNGGQLHSGQRKDQVTLEATVGRAAARRLWECGEAAKALVREIAARDRHGCFLADGLIAAAATPRHRDELAAYAEHLARHYDYERTIVLSAAETAAAIGSERYVGGVRDGGAFHLDPYRLARALAEAAVEAGAVVHERARVADIRRAGGRWRLATEGGPSLDADAVVVAANGYLGRLLPAVAAHVLPLNNFIAATAPLPEDVFRRILPGGEGVSDTRFVIRYWRPTADRRIAFGGGESYGDRFPADVARFVRPYLAEVYPALADAPIEHAWGGTLAITPTRNPYMRRLAEGLYVACGFSGQGVGTATFAGRVLAEAIRGDTETLDVFAGLPVPRFPGGTRLRRPLLALAMTWFALRDRLGI